MNETLYKLTNDYTIKVITDINSFNSLRPIWNQLLQNYRAHVPFLCFDWFSLWLQHFMNNKTLLILQLQKQDKTLAIAPFIVSSDVFKGLFRVNKVSLIGNVHSPIRNFIFRDQTDGLRREWSFLLLSFFKSYLRRWDLIQLDYLPEEDNTFALFRKTIANLGFRSRHHTSFSDWYLDGINYSGADYHKQLPKRIRNELKRRKKRLAEIGTVTFQIGTDEASFDQYMNLYYRVRERSWKSPESDQDFHCDIRRIAAKKKWLRCGFLFLDDEPIAAQIRLVANKTVYFMEALHDSRFNKFGPGHILRSELINYFLDTDRVTEIDQVRGGEPYKKYWTPGGVARKRKNILVFNNTSKGNFLALLMTTMLPIFEKYPPLTTAKAKLSRYLPASPSH